MRSNGFLIILTTEILILFTYNIHGYSKVIKNGSAEANEDNNSTENEAPRIHRAREGVTNVDLWFPTV